jgi:hypothetical protein
MKKYSILLLAGVLIGLVWFNAEAIQTKPPTSMSWYVNAISGDTNSVLYSWMYSKGYAAGQVDLATPGTQDSVVILDFGQPVVQGGVYGASGFGRFLSVTVLKEAARQFAYGYWIGTGSDYGSQMRMVIGTNNLGSFTTYTHGQMWIQLVKDIGAQLQSYGYSSQVVVYGGIDIEPAYSTPGVAISWVNGYASGFVSPYFLFNYGSADGCPLSGATSTPANCNSGWNQDDVQYVSYATQPAYPLPEIYSTGGGNAKQWQQVSLYSYLAYGQAMWNIGPLSQKAAWDQRCAPKNPLPADCVGVNNTSQQAWNQFLTELNNDSRTAQDVWWSTDIKWRQ